MLDVTPDVVKIKYLFVGGWLWYWIVVACYFAVGVAYLHHFKEVSLGASWVFFSNSFMYFLGLVYKLRSPFDQQLMPLSTFVKSFDDGVISEIGIRRASSFLASVSPVQACVSLANPPAYAFLGQLPTAQSCCWSCQSFAKRVTFILIGSFVLGIVMVSAFVLKQIIFEPDPFADMNKCIQSCSAIAPKIGVNVSASLCSSCLCLCANTLDTAGNLLNLCHGHFVPANGCLRNMTCVSQASCQV
jgi:hypothetical protein